MSARVGWAALTAMVAVTVIAALRSLQFGIWTSGRPGPGLFPLLAGLLLVAAVPAVMIELRRPAPEDAEPGDESVPTPGKLATYMAVVMIWPLMLEPLGYTAATLLAMLVLLLRGGVGWLLSIAIAIAAVGASAFLFATLLEVPLPAAEWF